MIKGDLFMIRKVHCIKKLLVVGYLLYFHIPILAMDFAVHLEYCRLDGNRAFLVDTPEGVCIFTKKYKKNYHSLDSNDTNRALVMDMSGAHCKQIWHDSAYPKIAAAYDDNKTYLLAVGKNGNEKVVTVFDSDGEIVKQLEAEHKICSATPIKIGNDIGFILLTQNHYVKAFVWFLNDDQPCARLQQNDYIFSCAGVDTQWGYQIITGSSNVLYDGFMKSWDYEGLSREQFGRSQPRLHINSMSWWDAACSNVCKMLPKSIVGWLPDHLVNPHDYQNKFVDIAAIQSQGGDVFFIAGSESGAKIGKLRKDSVEFQPDIELLRGGLVSCVAAVSVPGDDLFLATMGDKIYIYTVHGDYVKELDFIIKKDTHADGFSALCKDKKMYIVVKNEENFCTWVLDAQSYNILERHEFSIENVTWS